jgi:hypothetical protein
VHVERGRVDPEEVLRHVEVLAPVPDPADPGLRGEDTEEHQIAGKQAESARTGWLRWARHGWRRA